MHFMILVVLLKFQLLQTATISKYFPLGRGKNISMASLPPTASNVQRFFSFHFPSLLSSPLFSCISFLSQYSSYKYACVFCDFILPLLLLVVLHIPFAYFPPFSIQTYFNFLCQCAFALSVCECELFILLLLQLQLLHCSCYKTTLYLNYYDNFADSIRVSCCLIINAASRTTKQQQLPQLIVCSSNIVNSNNQICLK